jgi:hypothetical protein
VSAPVAVSTTTELVRFVLARIDEDDAELKRLVRGAPAPPAGVGPGSIERRQAEARARRRIVGSVQQLLVLRDQPSERAVREVASQILRALAAPYADHAGFRSEWRTGSRR